MKLKEFCKAVGLTEDECRDALRVVWFRATPDERRILVDVPQFEASILCEIAGKEIPNPETILDDEWIFEVDEDFDYLAYANATDVGLRI